MSNEQENIFKRAACGAAIVLFMLTVGGCGTDDDETIVKKSPSEIPSEPIAQTTPPVESKVEIPVAPQIVTYRGSEQAFLDGRYHEAAAMFTTYTETNPDNPFGHYMLGLSAWKDGDCTTAELALTRAIALDPRHAKSRLNLARVLLDASRPTEALAVIDSAVTLPGPTSDAYRIRGRALHTLGRRDEAIAAYRAAIELNHGDAWAMNNLAFVLIELERYEEALPALARAVELRGDVAVFWNNLGMTLEKTGCFRAAGDAYARAVGVDPAGTKADANAKRVALVREDGDVTPPDLDQLARSFEVEIESWSTESLSSVAGSAAAVDTSTSNSE